MPAGLRVREVVGVVREAQGAATSSAPVLVMGFLADELARGLRAGSDDSGAVRVGRDPAGAAALLVVLGGPPGEAEESAMRAATRLGVPIVAVQADPRAQISLPYVLATEVVTCEAGQGFPVEEIAAVLAARLAHDAVALAARLPVLREPVARELVRVASRRAAVIGVLPWGKAPHFPALALVQTRLLLDLAAVHGRQLDADRAPELGAVAGAGLGLRALVRRLPRRLPLVGAVTGYLGTRAIGEAAIRRYAARG